MITTATATATKVATLVLLTEALADATEADYYTRAIALNGVLNVPAFGYDSRAMDSRDLGNFRRNCRESILDILAGLA